MDEQNLGLIASQDKGKRTMPINLNTAISALDTPSSLLPFFVKDAFDVTGRTVMAQNEGGKHEAREKFIEEAGTSLFWIGGIPAIRAISNQIYKKKLDTDIHFKRINSEGIQNYFANEVKQDGKFKFSAEDLEGINLKGKNLSEIKTKLTRSGYIANESKGFYKKFHVGTTTAGVLINLVMLMVALPQFNQFLSRKIISKEVQKNKKISSETAFGNNNNFDTFLNKAKGNNLKTKDKKTNFGSLKDFVDFKNLFNFAQMAESAQLNPQSAMLLLDYGISGSRVTIIPRNNNERIEYAIKEGGIILFFYYAADIIKAGLAKVANKYFKTPIDLDYKVLNNHDFAKALKNNPDKNKLLQFADIAEKDDKAELKVIKMIDQELEKTSKKTSKEKVFKNFTLQMAQKEGLIDVEFDDEIGKWIRHSKKYIQTDKVVDLNNNLKNFCEKAKENIKTGSFESNIENIISKTKKVKMASIIGNLAICCASLSFILPKIQYMIREHRTKTANAPGIKAYQEMAEKNLI